ncbi:MAG: family 20 glycosylhydrolase [Candidatus Eremiobacteraeota bacterium]|nr:family 20 glycosylhydrolase [Candidatus Eremiobacteraeota bacterium]
MLLAAALTLALIPQPARAQPHACAQPFRFERALRVSASTDAGAFAEVNERWHGLGIRTLATDAHPDVTVVHTPLGPQAYRLDVSGPRITIASGDAAGTFYAFMTLAQLPQRSGDGWTLPCVHIADAPALPWRILSDDVSRGPLPTMRYFKERIRTIAAFKMNGYSPYMEHVFVDPRNPLPAPLDGITPAQLRELAAYAKVFHVTFIPEQQSFAHMHNTLRWEQYAPAAELPHGYLMSPTSPLTYSYLQEVITDELAAVPHPPFFHIGSDEPSDLGRGQTKAAVDSQGDAAIYAAHVSRVASMVSKSGARVMIWDDAIQKHPDVLQHIPKNTVIINWHYGNEKTFVPYIKTIASQEFSQMVAPGANNWNEIFPDLAAAIPNERRFINEGKAAHVFGLFQTVWHDDGESLYEATWYPVLYAAAASWETGDVDPATFNRDFPAAFFGSSDPRFGTDVTTLGDIVKSLEADPYDSTDYLFWSDPLDGRIQHRLKAYDLPGIRKEAEGVLTHLMTTSVPLHKNAAKVMALAARRLDYLVRDYQIGDESRYYYNDALSHAADAKKGLVYRGLFISKYLFWEMRDNMEELAPLYATAWDYESRSAHRASVLERYHLAAQQAITRADKINAMTYEDYVPKGRFPSFDDVLGVSHP